VKKAEKKIKRMAGLEKALPFCITNQHLSGVTTEYFLEFDANLFQLRNLVGDLYHPVG